MGITRKKMLDQLATRGLASPKSAADVCKWLGEKALAGEIYTVGDVELSTETGAVTDAVEKAWNAMEPVNLALSEKSLAESGTTPDAAMEAYRAAKANGTGQTPRTVDAESSSFFIGNAERKSFNARAARGETVMPDADTAEIMGAYMKLALVGSKGFDGMSECQNIIRKANVSYDFASGGFAVPSILRNELINIRANYSALARLMPDTPVDISGESVPRRSTGVTVYSPGEGVTATESSPTGDQVKLTPYEMVALNTVSKTMLAKSNIDFGNWIAGEMMYAIAKKEEEIFFLGTGSSTYFNQVGLLGKMSKQVTDAGGTWTVGTNATNAEYHSAIVRAGGNLFSEFTEQNFLDMLARPTDVENPGSLAWVCNRSFYYSTMLRIARSKGGVPTSEIIAGVQTPMFEGHPVIFSNALPSTDAVAQVACYFGDFGTVAKRGTVQSTMELSTSTERYWELRKVGYQIAVHKAVNCHDLGTANSTTPAQTTPFAALISAES